MAENKGFFGLGGFLRHARIRNKLLLGFIPCVILLWIMAGYGIYALREINLDLDRFGELSDDVAAMADLQADTYRLRLEVNKYVRTGDETLHDIIEVHFGEMREALKYADEIISNPDRAAKIDVVKTVIPRYEQAFEKITDFTKQMGETVERDINAPSAAFQQSLDQLRNDLTEAQRVDDVALLSGYLEQFLQAFHIITESARTYEIGNLGDATSTLETLTNDLTTFQERMRSEGGRQAVADALAQIAQMQGALPQITQSIQERNTQIVDELDVAGPEVVKLIADVLHSVDNDRRAGDDHTKAEIRLARNVSIFLVIIGTLFALLIISAITAEVALPINHITRAMRQLAEGNQDVQIPGIDRRDESGRLAAAAQTFKENAEEIERLNKEERERDMLEAAEREAREREEKMRMEFMANEAKQFGSTVGDIVELLGESADEMRQTARLMSDTVAITRDESTQAAAACTQANANVDTVAASAEELSTNIAEVGKQMLEASEITAQASQQTKEASRLMDVLDTSATEIDDVIQLIDRIVNQTQLLSLNATIEANRAGEAGRGFTVVALEIKNLSEQTRNATQEIRQKVKNIQNSATASIDAIRNILEVFQRVEEIVNYISSAMSEQDAATGEIARNALEAATGTREAADGVNELATQVNQVGDSSSKVLDASEILGEQSKELRAAVRQFIQTITTDQSKTVCEVPRPS